MEIKIPAVGESVTEAVIGSWNKKTGEFVKRNEVLLLVETDKASVEVVAENDGVLEIKTEAGQTVPIGAVVGVLDTTAKASASTPQATASTGTSTPPTPTTTSTSGTGAEMHLSPAVQRVVAEKGLNPAAIQGTGKDGRITKEDALKASPSATQSVAPSTPTPSAPVAPAHAPTTPVTPGEIKRVPMTTIRRRIAERLVEAQHTAAILTTFNEIDMTNVYAIRAKYKEKFKEKHNVNLGFMGFFTKATIEALKAYPAVNASIEGTDILYKNFYNLGVAVGTEKGLIVPVIRGADQLSIAGIELAIRNFALKAKDGKITVDDLSNGTFTISNGGTYGSLMSTPILNYPQVGILGMHKVEDRPVAVNGKVEIRPMMYVALSYDHRIIDGKEAVGFLVKIKEGVEDPERLLIEV